jgi:hypothetical protein
VRTDKNKGGRALAVKLLPPCSFVWLRAACLPQYRRHVRLGHRPSKGAGFFLLRDRSVSGVLVSSGKQLTTQTQSSHDFVVLLYVRLFQVIKHTSALRNHLQQSAPRVIVFLVRLEMLGELVNALT